MDASQEKVGAVLYILLSFGGVSSTGKEGEVESIIKLLLSAVPKLCAGALSSAVTLTFASSVLMLPGIVQAYGSPVATSVVMISVVFQLYS